MLYLLAQAAQTEPPPAGWVGAADLATKRAHEDPQTFFALLAIAILLFIGLAIGVGIVRYVLPRIDLWLIAWREEKKLDREAHAENLKAIRSDAQQDNAATRELAKVQQDAIVQRVEGSVSRQTGEIQKISERLERQSETLRSIAAKVGVSILLVLLIACPAPLNVQQTLADRVRAATTQCKALPVGPVKTALCTRALLCQTQALAAAESLQKVQLARSAGDTDVAAETSAAGLSVLAEAACCSWASKPCNVP